jgi:hypothetical protein
LPRETHFSVDRVKPAQNGKNQPNRVSLTPAQHQVVWLEFYRDFETVKTALHVRPMVKLHEKLNRLCR